VAVPGVAATAEQEDISSLVRTPVPPAGEAAATEAELRRLEVREQIARSIREARRRFDQRALEHGASPRALEDYRVRQLDELEDQERVEDLDRWRVQRSPPAQAERVADDVRREISRAQERREIELRALETSQRIRDRRAAQIRSGVLGPERLREHDLPGAP
jgi:hypothetical protein